MAHELSKSRSENLKILAFINPIYFSPGPAQTSAPMVYRSAVSVRLLERFVKGSGEGAEESFDQFIFLSAKGLIADIFDLLNEVPQKTFVKELREPDFKATPPLDYDLSHGVYKRHVHNNFTSDFDINIHPVDSFTRQIIANKNNLKICLVLLPLNERFFMSKGEKYKSQIADFYQKYRERFSPLPLVDLTSLGQSDFLFADTMHFTEFGSSQVMSKVMESKCFKDLFGE